MTLEFIQCYYKDEHLSELYPFCVPHYCEELTPYFENSNIARVVPLLKADYLSLCSWRLKSKRRTGATEVILYHLGYDLTEEKILNNDFDIAILCPFDPYHDTIGFADSSHNYPYRQWDKAIAEFKNFIHVPDKLIGNAIYYNHFIARREIYQEYVKDCLAPAISFMEGKEVFRLPSGYREKKERMTRGTNEVQETLAKLSAYRGYPVLDWEIGVFILERLFRIWIEGKPFKIINL